MPLENQTIGPPISVIGILPEAKFVPSLDRVGIPSGVLGCRKIPAQEGPIPTCRPVRVDYCILLGKHCNLFTVGVGLARCKGRWSEDLARDRRLDAGYDSGAGHPQKPAT